MKKGEVKIGCWLLGKAETMNAKRKTQNCHYLHQIIFYNEVAPCNLNSSHNSCTGFLLNRDMVRTFFKVP